ncbi:MAG: hypothetical protein J4N81_16015, partial [Chloroflexi bacterium]|nr:hypothetical protein [Chloroflexota bacterium]
SLDRFVAESLRLVGYNFTSVHDEWASAPGIKDPVIIDGVREHNAVWVHADDSSKKDHAKLIIDNQIRTLWVYRKGGKMTGADQLRVLSYTLQQIIDNFHHWPNRRHYKLIPFGANPMMRIRIERYEITPPK